MLITIFTFANKVHIIAAISKSDHPVPLFSASLAQDTSPVKPFAHIFYKKHQKGHEPQMCSCPWKDFCHFERNTSRTTKLAQKTPLKRRKSARNKQMACKATAP